MHRKLVIGTRGSKLALTQTNWVKNELLKVYPFLSIEIKIIKTTGDRIQNIALDKIGDRGLFVKEIEEALLNKDVDLAVHSLKDMPGVDTLGLTFVDSMIRADARDILISKHAIESLTDLREGAVIGTGSKRRAFQLLELRPDLVIEGIRGNVDTRLKKLDDGLYDAIILAKAGLDRLGIQRQHYYIFEPNEMLPAPAQGILGVQVRQEDKEVLDLFKSLMHLDSDLQAKAERSFLRNIGGTCHMPIAAYATLVGEEIQLEGIFGSEDTSVFYRESIHGNRKDAVELGKQLAHSLRNKVISNG